jgi:RNA polymerase sigma-70 factor (ECF subfamily)
MARYVLRSGLVNRRRRSWPNQVGLGTHTACWPVISWPLTYTGSVTTQIKSAVRAPGAVLAAGVPVECERCHPNKSNAMVVAALAALVILMLRDTSGEAGIPRNRRTVSAWKGDVMAIVIDAAVDPGPSSGCRTKDACDDERWRRLADERQAVIRTLMRRGYRSADVEDWVHEAIVRIAVFDGIDANRVHALLLTVANRVGIDAHRADSRRAAHLIATAAALPPASPEDAATQRWELRRVLEIASHLPARERHVVLMRARDVPLPEIAVALGVSYKSAESALSRARAKLRHALAGAVAAERDGWGSPDPQP